MSAKFQQVTAGLGFAVPHAVPPRHAQQLHEADFRPTHLGSNSKGKQLRIVHRLCGFSGKGYLTLLPATIVTEHVQT
eukprot:CAMPEP_0175193026 /NCGR_PEP_ID=MMETSP0093-20121207/5753_1 /TAXON_ID=311494 /ORGANISM="Alexandrium monilatum, Strain CCMP3105" /LENGTH=76 /DNA_ID=CAMNT_0016485883 /DNA_START=29 /DNA_END=255 /DNA_ORIENTATION=+